jgi:hydroxymethylglutaryl-CoA reductase
MVNRAGGQTAQALQRQMYGTIERGMRLRAIQRVVARYGGRAVVRSFPWWLVKLAAPFNATLREMVNRAGGQTAQALQRQMYGTIERGMRLRA